MGRQRVSRETLRAEHGRAVTVAHGRAVQVVLRVVALVHSLLARVTRRHAVHHSVAERVGRRHALLLLAPVAEPHPHYLLLELQAVRERGYLLGRGLRLFVKVLLEGALYRDLDARALLAFPALGRYFVDVRGRARARVGLLEPLLQQGLQLAHVLETQLQGFEPAYRRLGEDVAVQGAERQANVGLGETELYSPLLELLGEGLEVVGGWRVLLAGAVVPVEARVSRVQRVSAASATGWAVIVGVPQVVRQSRLAVVVLQLVRVLMRLVVLENPVHSCVVLLQGGRRGRAPTRVVVRRGYDGRVPGVRRAHASARALVSVSTPVVTAHRRSHRGRLLGLLVSRCSRGRRSQGLHVQRGVRLVRMMVRVVTGGVVHAHRGRPGIAARLQARPRVPRAQATRVGQPVRRGRRAHVVVVLVMVVVLGRGHVLHLPGVGRAAGRARGVTTHGDVHPASGTRATIQVGRNCAANRHVRGSSHLLPGLSKLLLCSRSSGLYSRVRCPGPACQLNLRKQTHLFFSPLLSIVLAESNQSLVEDFESLLLFFETTIKKLSQ